MLMPLDRHAGKQAKVDIKNGKEKRDRQALLLVISCSSSDEGRKLLTRAIIEMQ